MVHHYTIILPDGKVFYDDFFMLINCYSPGMVVIDNLNLKYYSGVEWKEIETNRNKSFIMVIYEINSTVNRY